MSKSPLIASRPIIVYLPRGNPGPIPPPPLVLVCNNIFFLLPIYATSFCDPLTLHQLASNNIRSFYLVKLHIVAYLLGIMGDSSAAYIHMVQHLIEKCLIFNMTKEECMEALSKHANIEPVITSTVWNELEKENKDFFESYVQSKSKDDQMSEEETSQMIQKMISSESPKDSDDV